MVNRASTAEPGKNAAFDDGMASASPRVLVVEDDRDVAGLVGRELRALGFTVDVMGFAEDALAAARETEYSLMVVDIGLPDRDGLELVREMRKRSIAAPILMVTARGKVEDKVSGLANGADDYLVKPFAVPELRARIAALLRRPSSMKDNRLVVANIVVDRDALEAIVGGVRKMPLPMVMPTISAVPLENPMTLRRSFVTGVNSSAAREALVNYCPATAASVALPTSSATVR